MVEVGNHWNCGKNYARRSSEGAIGRGPILQTYKGAPLKYQGLRKVLIRLEARTGIECNPHTLRRTFATLSVKNGMPAFQLQRLMG